MSYAIRLWLKENEYLFFQFEFPHIKSMNIFCLINKSWLDWWPGLLNCFSPFVNERHSHGNFGPFKCQ